MTGPVYRSQDTQGRPVFSDRPPLHGTSGSERIEPHRAQQSEEERRQAHEFAKRAIKEAQNRIPKMLDYWDYLQFLRRHDPIRWDRVMRELMREDPQTWLKLQKHPQFQPLRRTQLGIKAAEKHLSAGIGLLSGKYTGSVEKWLTTTVQEQMKINRWGPYADALGAKATTLPTKSPTYSKSRLGQYLQTEDARLAAAGKESTKAMETSRATLRTARATPVSRVGNTLIDLGIGALDSEVHSGATALTMRLRLDKAAQAHPDFNIDGPKYELARQLISQGKVAQFTTFMELHGQ